MDTRSDTVISVDFDGVLHDYKAKWQAADVIQDGPVPGAIEWLIGIVEHHFVVIHTVRANIEGADLAILAWLSKNGVPDAALERIAVSAEKPNAIVFLDDRAWRFEGPGTFPSAEQIEDFRPWNKKADATGPQGIVGGGS